MRWLVAVMIALAASMVVGMTPEAARSFEEFERRAEGGDPAALYRLSAILEEGYDSIAPDTVRAMALLRRSAALGYAPALNYMGYLYQKGTILPESKDSAILYIRRAADAGDLQAAHNLAYLILEDRGPLRGDTLLAAEAMAYLRRAAEGGRPQSQTLLADLYAEGDLVPADTLRAVGLYEQAISQGFHDAELRLLNMMGPKWQSLDGSETLTEAKRYWNMGAPTIAVELLHLVGPMEAGTAQAYAMLGHAYSRGQGAPYDHRRANEYFARAALLGNPSAQFILAETLEIFPDALSDLLPDLPESMTPGALREAAAAAGVTSAETAVASLFR